MTTVIIITTNSVMISTSVMNTAMMTVNMTLMIIMMMMKEILMMMFQTYLHKNSIHNNCHKLLHPNQAYWYSFYVRLSFSSLYLSPSSFSLLNSFRNHKQHQQALSVSQPLGEGTPQSESSTCKPLWKPPWAITSSTSYNFQVPICQNKIPSDSSMYSTRPGLIQGR